MGELNNLFGKKHSEESKELMRQKALGRIHSEETKLLMSTKRGSFVNILERCDKDPRGACGCGVGFALGF